MEFNSSSLLGFFSELYHASRELAQQRAHGTLGTSPGTRAAALGGEMNLATGDMGSASVSMEKLTLPEGTTQAALLSTYYTPSSVPSAWDAPFPSAPTDVLRRLHHNHPHL